MEAMMARLTEGFSGDSETGEFKKTVKSLLLDRKLPHEMGFGAFTVDIGEGNVLSFSFMSGVQVQGLLRKNGDYREDLWQEWYSYDEANKLVDDVVRLKANPPKEESDDEEE